MQQLSTGSVPRDAVATESLPEIDEMPQDTDEALSNSPEL